MVAPDLAERGFVCANRLANRWFGERWAAVSLETGQRYAVELVLPDSEAMALLCRNGEYAERLTDHPGLANIACAGWLEDGRFFQVLEVAPEAVSLESYVTCGGVVPDSEVRDLAWQLAEALRYLQAQELCHNAVTPAGILIDDGVCRLSDMWWMTLDTGEPLALDPDALLRNSYPVQAINFVAPEIVAGYPAHTLSDVYSLGAVLFFAISGGQLPDPVAGALSISTQLHVLKPLVSPTLTKLVERMLDLDFKQRPGFDEIREVLSGAMQPAAGPQDITKLDRGDTVRMLVKKDDKGNLQISKYSDETVPGVPKAGSSEAWSAGADVKEPKKAVVAAVTSETWLLPRKTGETPAPQMAPTDPGSALRSSGSSQPAAKSTLSEADTLSLVGKAQRSRPLSSSENAAIQSFMADWQQVFSRYGIKFEGKAPETNPQIAYIVRVSMNAEANPAAPAIASHALYGLACLVKDAEWDIQSTERVISRLVPDPATHALSVSSYLLPPHIKGPSD